MGGNTYCKCFNINPSLSAESKKMLTFELDYGIVGLELSRSREFLPNDRFEFMHYGLEASQITLPAHSA